MAPLRLIVVVGGQGESKAKLSELILKDKTTQVFIANSFQYLRLELEKGRVVIFKPRNQRGYNIISRIVKSRAPVNSSWLVHLTFGGKADEKLEDKDMANYEKVITVGSDADVEKVANDIREELFGAKASPIVLYNPPYRILAGDFTGEVTREVCLEAFKPFGQVKWVNIIAPGKLQVGFAHAAGAHAALQKKQVTCGSVTVDLRVRERPPAVNPVILRIENCPSNMDKKALSNEFQRFGKVVDVRSNPKQNVATVRFETSDAVQKALKEKIVLENVELKLQGLDERPRPKYARKPYQAPLNNTAKETTSNGTTKPNKSDKSKTVSNKATKEAKPARIPRLVVSGRGIENCTNDELSQVFKNFKGFKKLEQRGTRVYVTYEDPDSVKEVLTSKELICGTASLKVSSENFRRRVNRRIGYKRAGSRQPSKRAENGISIKNFPEAAEKKDFEEAFSKFDSQVRIDHRKGKKIPFATFSSQDIKSDVLKKNITINGMQVQMESRVPEIPADRGVYVQGVERSDEEELRKVLQPYGDIKEMRFRQHTKSCIVGFSTPEKIQQLLTAPLTMKEKPLVLKPLRA